jgi:hypothetical protein
MRKLAINHRTWGVALSLFGMAVVAQAQLNYDPIGTANPPPLLGTWSMTQFGADTFNNPPSSSYLDATQVPGPNGTFLMFNEALSHDTIGNNWATWGQGYSGDVYDTVGASGSSLTITLPSLTHAFDFYAQPNQYADFTVTVLDQNGGTYVQTVNGNGGAAGFGFYDDAATLSSVTISSSDDSFAVGEFGIARTSSGVPEGGSTLCYCALGLLPLCGVAFRLNRAG